MSAYPLYDVPWLVRDPNDFRMSEKRHRIEVRNQAVVDDYFVARANGAPAHEATIFWKNFCLWRNTKVTLTLSLQRILRKGPLFLMPNLCARSA